LNYNIPVAESFGFGAIGENRSFTGGALAGNPIMAFADKGYSLLSALNITGNTYSGLAFFTTTQEQNGSGISGFASEFGFSAGGLGLSSQLGFVAEEGAILGSRMGGAFESGNTPTWLFNLTGGLDVTDDIRLFGSFTGGYTTPGK